ncbi:exodeoxyribonuclease VII large subunit [Robertmurraya beringensis]|uniref:Exodeoxyribonuclease 7 large subunit n=1 Tax=Robertmurraya beringensis TaxID=641660 RepID=A0ABV6KMF8_9BACI|nr:exodeoxyribonuclease VII large subunit [Mycobacteroides abscessus subsp. abscessus]
MEEKQYVTITALTKYIKRKFDADPHLQDMYVKGEISNFKQHSSGHMYFTLKDEKARILAVMFSSFNKSIKFRPENGMKVLVKGDISVYEQSGQYQMYIKELQPDGIGDLYLAFEQLKEKLLKQGLFSNEYKKALPKYPHTVGVITSPTGAAIRDILTTLKRRYPIANILVIPALVQGEQGAASIVKAIEQANQSHDIDVLIVGRGGGSIEELWSFNEEIVARAIFASRIPIISAVGHETDTTIADYVADLRAPTPTGAAELAVPHIDELIERVLTRQTRIIRKIKEKISVQAQRYDRLSKSYAFKYPQRLYEQKLEQVDKSTELLKRAAQALFVNKNEEYIRTRRRLERNNLNTLLQTAVQQQSKTEKTLNRAFTSLLLAKKKEHQRVNMALDALSPLKIMDRGYSLVYNEDDHLVKSTEQIRINDSIKIKLVDGSITCEVLEIEGKDQTNE